MTTAPYHIDEASALFDRTDASEQSYEEDDDSDGDGQNRRAEIVLRHENLEVAIDGFNCWPNRYQ